MFPFLPKSISTGDVKLASGVVRPLVSEVRPLMEQNQDQTKHPVCVSDQGHSVAHEGNLKVRIQTEIQPQKKGPEDRCPPEKVPPQALRCSPLKKKSPAVDPRRNARPVAKAAASHLASSGLRKAQSVHNLHTEGNTQHTRSLHTHTHTHTHTRVNLRSRYICFCLMYPQISPCLWADLPRRWPPRPSRWP